MVQKDKPENISFAVDMYFTVVLFHINSALNDSFSPSNYISVLTFFSDFDTFLNARQHVFFQIFLQT
jgi:hypothetical protein